MNSSRMEITFSMHGPGNGYSTGNTSYTLESPLKYCIGATCSYGSGNEWDVIIVGNTIYYSLC